jgi:hypothetical protein
VSRQLLLAWLAILAAISAFFAPAIIRGSPLLFRDSAHFYYPLFEWCCREWSAGRIPLWNPYENCGSPMLADASSSILYPGKLLFGLPLSYGTRFNFYILIHVLLAAANCYAAARSWRASQAAAAMAAISYSCGGAVLFQYCNIVFLVGAAWLPLALLHAERMLRQGQWTASLGMGAVLSLMVLGGDPQTACHSLLAAALYAGILCWRAAPATIPKKTQFWLSRLGLCALAAIVAFALSAAQILPSMEATSRSDRATFDRPRNIYEAASIFWHSGTHDEAANETQWQLIARGLLGEPKALTHHEAVYDFSVGPWQLAEFIWPNIGGRLFPTNLRWFSLLPADSRVWTPILYLGLLPALLAVGAMCAPSRDFREAWLKGLLGLSLAASLGNFGLGWALRELVNATAMKAPFVEAMGDPVGGLYWLLTTVLPGYVYFRYPAKWLPVATLAISLLSAKWFDRVFARREKWIVSSLAIFCAGSFITAVAIWVFGGQLFAAATAADSTLGPFDAAAARHDVIRALLHSSLIGMLFASLVRWATRQPIHQALIKWTLVFLTAADIWIANSWTIVSIDASPESIKSSLVSAISTDTASTSDFRGAPRVFRGNVATWRPPSFQTTQSSSRLMELARWERQTLNPKYPLLDGIAIAESHGSIVSANYQALLYVAKQHGPRQSDNSLTPQPTALRILGTEYLVLPESHKIDFASRMQPTTSDWPESAALWRMQRTMPRCWIVHEVESWPLLEQPLSTHAIEERTRAVLFPNGKPRDFSRQTVVETGDSSPPWAELIGRDRRATNATAEDCQITYDSPQRVVVAANPSQSGLLVIADAWYPGWTATITLNDGAHPATIYRTNRILRGVWLGTGPQTIEFRYQPGSFYTGALISVISWLALAIVGIYRYVRQRTRPVG